MKSFNIDLRNSKNSIHNTTITTHHNEDETSTSILKENLNTANYEIKVLRKKLEMSNLKLLSAQEKIFKIEESYRNSIINASFNMTNKSKNKDDNDNHLLDNNQSKQFNSENGNEISSKDVNHEKHEHKHDNYISENEYDDINERKVEDKDEDEGLDSNVIQINVDNSKMKVNTKKNTIENRARPITESDNINNDGENDNNNNNDNDNNNDDDNSIKIDNINNDSNGKYNDIPIKSSHDKDEDKQTITSPSLTTINMIQFSDNQSSRLEKSKEFFCSEKIISMSKKLKILKEKLIDRRYWKQVALCVAEAAVLACASTVPIPTLDRIERSSVRHYNNSNRRNNNSINNNHNNNDSNNNKGNNDKDEYSPLFSDIRVTRHLSSSRYRGSVLINEELVRTVLVMSKVCDVMCYGVMCYGVMYYGVM